MVHTKNSNTRLEIIGDGALRSEIEQWIHNHNLTDVITLHGWQDDVKACMIDWHAFVLSSLWEGLPCAVVEARLLKLPVLSYNTGGIADIIINKQNGYLYPQKEWQSLAHGMLELTQKKDMFEQLSRHKDNLNDFKMEAMLEQHIDVYTSLYTPERL